MAALAATLTALALLGYAASQTVLAPVSAPRIGDAPAYVAAPAPTPAPAPVAPPGEQVALPRVDERWLAETAESAGVPVPALRAYATAQLSTPVGCEVGWTTLAGIGWVESRHGTIEGRVLGLDGRSSTPILGPALDGREGFAAIASTPESRHWHGDGRWDHAVGPMQFIPSTWEQWARDGDGDGVADPHDLDDAAAAAAAYLCADGHDLSSAAGWAGAVFSYNRAQEYVDAVHAAAESYAERTAD